jgi:hypothetical protein
VTPEFDLPASFVDLAGGADKFLAIRHASL